ncbi:MAG: hypothetical protein ACREUE_03190, partial [Panacagrimonas sp.]
MLRALLLLGLALLRALLCAALLGGSIFATRLLALRLTAAGSLRLWLCAAIPIASLAVALVTPCLLLLAALVAAATAATSFVAPLAIAATFGTIALVASRRRFVARRALGLGSRLDRLFLTRA